MTETESANVTAVAVTKTGIPIRNLWHMFLYDWDAWRLKDHWRAEVEAAPSLDALLGSILVSLVQQRLRIGLGRNYRDDESLISGIRGRVDFSQSLKRLAFQHGRAYCRCQTFSANVPKNQIIRSTVARLVQVGDFGPDRPLANELRSKMRRLVHNTASIDLIDLKIERIRREQLGRHDADYSLMLAICYLLLQRQMPTETIGNSKLPFLDRDECTLFEVYERFVAKFYTVHLLDWIVSPQRKFKWPAAQPSGFLPIMSPDLVLTHKVTSKRVVLDTKFTQHILVPGAWNNLVFSRDHLFQLYAYLRSQEETSDHHRTATGILLYPTVNHRLSEFVSIQGHEFRWETIDLAQPWEEIEEDLLKIPAATLSAEG